tara:strand:- start:105 stop:419 length:315 start_codon:yes stop_codon:yes gene_type:complete
MSGVKITGLKVGLTTDKRARHASHMREGSEICGPVEKLTNTTPAPNPITGRKSVHNLRLENIRAQATANLQIALSIVVAFKLILEIASKLLKANTEEILHEISS